MKKKIQAMVIKGIKRLRQILPPVLMVAMWATFITVIIAVVSKHDQFLLSYFFSFTDLVEDPDKDTLKARNLLLMLTALAAFPLAIHRTVVADEQLKATEEQLKQSKREPREKALKGWQRDLLSGDKFSREHSALKKNAINELWELAEKQPKECHIKVMDILSRSIEDWVFEVGFDNEKKEALKRLLNQRDLYKNAEQKAEERRNKYRICLRGCRFSYMDLSSSDLSGVDFSWSHLQSVNFSNSTLTKASFRGATLEKINSNDTNLSHVDFRWSHLNEIDFSRTNLTGAIFEKIFMTQVNLEENTTIKKAHWKSIVIEKEEDVILSNPSHRKSVMNKPEIKNEDEWDKERQTMKQAELDKIRQSRRSSSSHPLPFWTETL